MYDEIVRRLQTFGYTVEDNDQFVINLIREQEEQDVKNRCHLKKVPDALRYYIIDRTCGRLLAEKKNAGKLNVEQFEFGTEQIKSIAEGDIQISFSDNNITAEQKFDMLIAYLTDKKVSFSCFRKLKW
jgi:hypothetical protein|nr:MAG TPA: head to tail adaptor [Caudoviricetes sp.]